VFKKQLNWKLTPASCDYIYPILSGCKHSPMGAESHSEHIWSLTKRLLL